MIRRTAVHNRGKYRSVGGKSKGRMAFLQLMECGFIVFVIWPLKKIWTLKKHQNTREDDSEFEQRTVTGGYGSIGHCSENQWNPLLHNTELWLLKWPSQTADLIPGMDTAQCFLIVIAAPTFYKYRVRTAEPLLRFCFFFFNLKNIY